MDNFDEPLKNYRIEQCTNNRLMMEKVEKFIKKEVERLQACYGRTSQKTVDAYATELLKANFSPNEVGEVVTAILGESTSMPSLVEVKKLLHVKFKPTIKKGSSDRYKEQAKKEREEYNKMEKDLKEKIKLSDEDIMKWTKYYVREVFGEAVLNCDYLGAFKQIAVKDLIRSNMNQKQAIARGLKEIGQRA